MQGPLWGNITTLYKTKYSRASRSAFSMESVEELDWIFEKENYSYTCTCIRKDAVIRASKGLTHFP